MSDTQQIERIREAQSVADLLRDWSDACGVEFDGIRQVTDSRVTRLALEALVNEARAPLLARLEECESEIDKLRRVLQGVQIMANTGAFDAFKGETWLLRVSAILEQEQSHG